MWRQTKSKALVISRNMPAIVTFSFSPSVIYVIKENQAKAVEQFFLNPYSCTLRMLQDIIYFFCILVYIILTRILSNIMNVQLL